MGKVQHTSNNNISNTNDPQYQKACVIIKFTPIKKRKKKKVIIKYIDFVHFWIPKFGVIFIISI